MSFCVIQAISVLSSILFSIPQLCELSNCTTCSAGAVGASELVVAAGIKSF